MWDTLTALDVLDSFELVYTVGEGGDYIIDAEFIASKRDLCTCNERKTAWLPQRE